MARHARVPTRVGLVMALAGCVTPAPPPAAPPVVAPLPAPCIHQPARITLVQPEFHFQIRVHGRRQTLHSRQDYLMESTWVKGPIGPITSGWVFAGYGVSEPALGRDDYQGESFKGKTILLLGGEPPVSDASSKNGRARTGSWRTQVENARRHGATLVLMVQQDTGKGSDYEHRALFASQVLETLPQDPQDNLFVYGWVPASRVAAWLRQAGIQWELLRKTALETGFRPSELPLQSHLDLIPHHETVELAARTAGAQSQVTRLSR